MSTNLLPEYVPPIHDDFTWRTDESGYHLHHDLIFKGEYTGIRIDGSEVGAYLVSLGGRIILEATTIRQAQASAQALGEALRDKLPVPEFVLEMHREG